MKRDTKKLTVKQNISEFIIGSGWQMYIVCHNISFVFIL